MNEKTLLKKTNKICVDVILPNYNKSKFLEEAINSVIMQTYKNWHMYIIDDNSNDNSWSVIKKFSNLSNVTHIRLNKNMGPSFCRNYGMRISQSKYIAFIDSDDGWSNNKLEKQISFMEKNSFNFTYTDHTLFFDINGKKNFKKKTNIRNYFDYDSFTKNSTINTTTMIITRSILRNHRFKKIEMHEDYLFKCEILKNNNIANKLNENTAFYRILNTSRSRKRLQSIYWLWHINKNFNKLNFIRNIISIFFITMNSLKKYGRIK